MDIEHEVAKWRGTMAARGVTGQEIDELEDHLLSQVHDLQERGLSPAEALLIGLNRLGDDNDLGKEFSKLHIGRVWKQLKSDSRRRVSASAMRNKGFLSEPMILASLCALQFLISQIPQILGYALDERTSFSILVNTEILMFTAISAYLLWKRNFNIRICIVYGLVYIAMALLLNLYHAFLDNPEQTWVLILIHLPLLLWYMQFPLYVGTRDISKPARQMDFIRFTGELFLYGVLLACSLAVLTASTLFLFGDIGYEPGDRVYQLIATGIVPLLPLVAASLVEAKGHLIENFAPVLARIFLPLFMVMLVVFMFSSLAQGIPMSGNRDLLIAIDLLLVLVIAMILYNLSVLPDDENRSAWDAVILFSSIAAALVDIIALAAILQRFSVFGITINRVAALGENILLLGNLILLALLAVLFLTGRVSRSAIIRFQGWYMSVYALWFVVVVIVFPLVF